MNAVQINKLYKNCGSDADITDLDVDIDDLLKKMGRTRTRIWKNTTLADIHADILTALNSLDGIKPSALKSSRQTNALPVRGRVERDHLGKYVRWIRIAEQIRDVLPHGLAGSWLI
jgi:hypothetical protein